MIGDVYFVGGCAIGRFDLPEGNDAAGTKRHNANCGCRRCYHAKGSLDKFDEACTSDRSFHRDSNVRTEFAGGPVTARKEKFVELGLHERDTLFRGLAFDPYRQTPHDPFHCEFMGMAKKATTNLCKSLTKPAINAINSKLERVDVPSHWQRRLPAWKLNTAKSGTASSLKYTGGQLGKFMQLAGIVFKGTLRETSFKDLAAEDFQSRLGPDWVNVIVRSFVALGKLNAELFRSDHSGDVVTCAEFIGCVAVDSRKAFLKVWAPRVKKGYTETPSVHLAAHYSQTHTDYGGNRLANCERSETKHGPLRRVVNNTNHRQLEVDMLDWARIQHGIDFLGAGGAQHLEDERPPETGFMEFLNDPVIYSMMRRNHDNSTLYEADDEDNPFVWGDTDNGPENAGIANIDRTGTKIAVRDDLRALMRLRPTLEAAADMTWPSLQVKSHTCMQLIGREAWRSKLYQGGFFSLKGALRGQSVFYCRELFVFSVNDTKLQDGNLRVPMVLMERAVPTGVYCETTGFPFVKLSKQLALVHIIDIASPLHVVHTCTGDCDGQLEHDIESNPTFMLNATFFK